MAEDRRAVEAEPVEDRGEPQGIVGLPADRCGEHAPPGIADDVDRIEAEAGGKVGDVGEPGDGADRDAGKEDERQRVGRPGDVDVGRAERRLDVDGRDRHRPAAEKRVVGSEIGRPASGIPEDFDGHSGLRSG